MSPTSYQTALPRVSVVLYYISKRNLSNGKFICLKRFTLRKAGMQEIFGGHQTEIPVSTTNASSIGSSASKISFPNVSI